MPYLSENMRKKMFFTSKCDRGYSLVEMLTVVMVFGVLAMASSNLFFSSLVGSGKEAALRQIKQNGEFTVVQIENSMRGAESLVENAEGKVCEDGEMSAIAYEALDGSVKEIGLVEGKMVISETDENGMDQGSNVVLTADDINVYTDQYTEGHGTGYPSESSDPTLFQPFEIKCNRDSGSGSTLVEVNFTLYKGGVQDKPEERYAERFQAKVNLRNR